MTLTVLTPTGGRADGLRLLAGYLAAQTYAGPVHWIVVDDCDPETPIPPMPERFTVTQVRPGLRWQPGMNTQCSSMVAGLTLVPSDARLVIAEDDDFYGPDHLAMCNAALDSVELVGERVARYYNVATRRCKELPGTYHASLASTAVRGKALGLLRALCLRGERNIDMTLWKLFLGTKALTHARNVVGLKGLPGRQGIGVGHRDTFGTPDPHGDVLRDWLGDAAMHYRWFARSAA